MKACFLLQRRFAYVGHAMAKILSEKYGVNEFCGYVSVRASFDFLKSQKDIKYSALLLDDEIHKKFKAEPLDYNYLKELEKRFGMPNLWPYIEMDRVVRRNQLLREYPYDTPPYTHEEMLKILQVKTKAIWKFLQKERPDVLILTVVADIATLFLLNAAKSMGVRVLFLKPARVGELHTLTEDFPNLSFAENVFAKLQSGAMSLPEEKRRAEKFLKEFREKPSPYSHQDTPDKKPVSKRRQFAFLAPAKFLISLRWTLKVFIDYAKNPHKDDLFVVKPWHYVWDRLKRKARVLIGFEDLYDEIDFRENYAFFPLQYEPEAGTSVFSKFYTDQLWLIQQIARSLPVDFKLYVKEHPAMYGYRSRRFYKELKKIPNLKLIRPTEWSFDLIKHSKLIATITGTSGWEGILLKKPIITFGDVFYNKLPMAKKCENINDLPYLIKERVENFHHDEKKLIDFLTAIYKESVDVDLIKIWEIEGGAHVEKNKQALTAYVDLIAEKLDLKPRN
ncbi:MAG: hypothetical protein UV75_C0003G0053 [Candidatus Giovannonibacteria bacterium GW2011_GWA1_43_15]|nr:MAG: hypothetical protein UV72_C0007G0032 [Candidatus Giovannonibacteria bacterium GW2011_GWB1_43_13]KKS99577.1 MAG: hypothetical protein UV75_C0003G0053 [Candidatus Giovannonibacteria bacterium GW2011_GWA1_43_15]KKT63436.1 MAG: hypothetical protein UW55_C0003G0004 [Candidatus Giovannonibacteria bacterium GW2011_GWA2_44_26]